MIELSSKIVEVLQSGNILWLAIFLVLAVIVNSSKIINFLTAWKKIQIKRLEEAYSCQFLDENFKNFIRQEIQREYFLYTSKIAAERQYREKLFEIHNNSNGNIPFFHFRRASGFIRYKDNSVVVKIETTEVVSYYLNNIAFAFYLIVGFSLFFIPVTSKSTSVLQV